MGNKCGGQQGRDQTNNERLQINQKSQHEGKIVLIGSQSVGKSSIIQRFQKNQFIQNEIMPTLGASYIKKAIQLKNNVDINLHIWDTAGQERFRCINSMFYRDSQAVVMCYDIQSKQSFKDIEEYWYEETIKNLGNDDDYIMILLGNKCDVDPVNREVEKKTAQKFADSKKIYFQEVSAKSGVGINEVFQRIANQIYEKEKQQI